MKDRAVRLCGSVPNAALLWAAQETAEHTPGIVGVRNDLTFFTSRMSQLERHRAMNATEVQQFKERLLNLRDQLRGDIQASIEAVADEVRPVGEDAQEPSEGLDKELVLESNEEEIYHAVNAALQRIEDGTFGRCMECGKRIPRTRLNAIPYAAYCIDCERRAEKRQS